MLTAFMLYLVVGMVRWVWVGAVPRNKYEYWNPTVSRRENPRHFRQMISACCFMLLLLTAYDVVILAKYGWI